MSTAATDGAAVQEKAVVKPLGMRKNGTSTTLSRSSFESANSTYQANNGTLRKRLSVRVLA